MQGTLKETSQIKEINNKVKKKMIFLNNLSIIIINNNNNNIKYKLILKQKKINYKK